MDISNKKINRKSEARFALHQLKETHTIKSEMPSRRKQEKPKQKQNLGENLLNDAIVQSDNAPALATKGNFLTYLKYFLYFYSRFISLFFFKLKFSLRGGGSNFIELLR